MKNASDNDHCAIASLMRLTIECANKTGSLRSDMDSFVQVRDDGCAVKL